MRKLCRPAPGWGLLDRASVTLLEPRDADDLRDWLASDTSGPVGARGLGRSYGDAASGARMLLTRPLRQVWDLDADRGLLRAGAGWSLGELTARTLPFGWAPVVLPGTRHVTLGGAIAADVHGKNHHVEGAFCRHVDTLHVLGADGQVRECSREILPDLFAICCGGMGLAGLVLDVTLRLARRRGDHFRRRTLACADLDSALLALRQATESHTVAWVDAASDGHALGRALVYLGEPVDAPDHAPRTHGENAVPTPHMGLCVVRPALMRAFNAAVWMGGRRRHGREDLQHYASFFWPLDVLADWNRLYGLTGLLQFQCLLPDELLARRGAAPFMELLRLFQSARGGALAVMKTMGSRDEATASIAFPGPGVTLAVDLPATPAGRAAVRRANRLAADWGGRVYLAKDALLEPAEFAAMCPELPAWRALRERWDPQRRWVTDLSLRLDL